MIARLCWASAILFGILILLGWLGPASVGPVTAAPAMAASSDGLDGEQVFLGQKCNLCHGVEAADIEAKTKSDKLKGPDLSDVTERHDDDWLAKYLRKEEALDGEEHKKPFTGSDEELGAMIAWFHALADAQADG